MVAAAKKNLGKMPCPHCAGPVAVMEAGTGTLSYKCQEADCEATGFAAAHTAAARKWRAVLPAAAPAAAPVAAIAKPIKQAPVTAPKVPAVEVPPVPAKTPPRTAFSLGALL